MRQKVFGHVDRHQKWVSIWNECDRVAKENMRRIEYYELTMWNDKIVISHDGFLPNCVLSFFGLRFFPSVCDPTVWPRDARQLHTQSYWLSIPYFIVSHSDTVVCYFSERPVSIHQRPVNRVHVACLRRPKQNVIFYCLRCIRYRPLNRSVVFARLRR